MTPYLWFANNNVNLSSGDISVDEAISFADIIDKVDLGFQIHVEGNRDRFGFLVDVTYVSLSDKQKQDPLAPFEGQLELKTDLETWLIEGAGTYRLFGDAKTNAFDLLLGVRVIDVEVDLDIDFAGPLGMSRSVTASDTLTDGFIGARYIHAFSSNWVVGVRGDVGTGDSDITWNGQAELIYLFGKNNQFGAVLGYRYLYAEYESSDRGQKIEVDLTISGPELGFAYRF